MTSTRAKAQHKIKHSGPFLRRDLAHFYSAIDTPSDGEEILADASDAGLEPGAVESNQPTDTINEDGA